jgi:diacylglycerol kinase (ATP)
MGRQLERAVRQTLHETDGAAVKPGKTGLARLFDAAGYSFKGLRAAWRDEAAFRQELALSAVLFPLSFLVARSIEQWLLLTTPLLLLLLVELLNTAIENVVDRIGHERHDLSGQAKDMGSAAVLICLLMIAVSWLTIGWKNFS